MKHPLEIESISAANWSDLVADIRSERLHVEPVLVAAGVVLKESIHGNIL
jgi:hypothetical protein